MCYIIFLGFFRQLLYNLSKTTLALFTFRSEFYIFFRIESCYNCHQPSHQPSFIINYYKILKDKKTMNSLTHNIRIYIEKNIPNIFFFSFSFIKKSSNSKSQKWQQCFFFSCVNYNHKNITVLVKID